MADTTSNVGGRRTYEADDQRKHTQDEVNEMQKEDRFHEGKKNAHNADDPKDERSIANRLARESKRESESEGEQSLEAQQVKQDATLPARAHGNEPSKGAKIDQQIKEEEEAELAKKGSFGPK